MKRSPAWIPAAFNGPPPLPLSLSPRNRDSLSSRRPTTGQFFSSFSRARQERGDSLSVLTNVRCDRKRERGFPAAAGSHANNDNVFIFSSSPGRAPFFSIISITRHGRVIYIALTDYGSSTRDVFSRFLLLFVDINYPNE